MLRYSLITVLVFFNFIGIAWAELQDEIAPLEQAEQEATFDIWEFRVKGNELLQVADIERIVYAYLGPKRSFSDVEAARDALQAAYKDVGYTQVQVFIPPQSQVDQGVVILAVNEAKVERTWVSGSKYFSPRDIRDQVPAIAAGNTIQEEDFRAELNEVNRRNPDLSVVPVLRPGKAPGTVEVELKVKDELPLHGGIELNNQHSEDTTSTRIEVSASYGNLWQADHKLGLLAIVAPEETDDSKVFSANYLMPVGERDKLLAYYLRTDSDVETVGGLSVIGSGNIFGANYIMPREPREDLFHTVMFGVEYRDLTNETIGVSDRPIDYLTLSASWLGRWIHSTEVTTDFNIKATVGLDGVVNQEEEFELNRIDAEPGFMLVNVDFTHERESWMESKLRFRTAGQFTSQPLISNLQYAAGGATSVRGYHESQELRDNGVFTSVEWVSPNLAPKLFEHGSSDKTEFHLGAFVDAAWLWDDMPAANPLDESINLVSIGLGAEVRAFDEAYAELDVAHPMNDAGTVEKGDIFWHLRVGYEF